MRNKTSLSLFLLRQGLDPMQVITWLELHQALAGCDKVLDVGCGVGSPIGCFGFQQLTGIDGYVPSVEAARRKGAHQEVVLGDVRELKQLFRPGQFDACVAIDVIEHLPKEDGNRLLEDMERCATRKAVLLTPNGFLTQAHAEREDLQEHLSGWESDEMRARGYRVVGILGPKGLRGEQHVLRYSPK